MAKRKSSKKSSQQAAPTKKSSGKAGELPRSRGLRALERQLKLLDRDLLARMNERAELALEVYRHQTDQQDAANGPAASEAMIDELVAQQRGPLPAHAVRCIFRELYSGCRAMQHPTRAAFLGPEFTYSHLAAIHRFGQSVELAPVATIAAVFEAVQRGQADYGLVPMENSTDGRISDTLYMFAQTPLKICGEVPLRIHHNLLGIGARGEVRHVYSKPQALSQCRNWLARQLPAADIHEVASTAEAARLAREDRTTAAVASRQAATNYHLNVLAENIEDDPQNLTRFAVIGQHPAERTGDDKSALLFEVHHQPGALADVMGVFKRNRLNLTWIESFPLPGTPGRYLFFVELEGHQEELRVRRAVESLEKKTTRLEILGSYARHEPID